MHPSRRRKKRPNYGIRTVEVLRGPNGFGFTISGQQPCILSCIVNNSPADLAGLRAGDFLISVNGASVSKMAHDDVVSLIGNAAGPIRMTVAENYYSDSSDEERESAKMGNSRKPKYTHKPRTRTHKTDLRRTAVESSETNFQKMRECIAKQLTNESMNVFNEHSPEEPLNVSNPVPMDDEAGPMEYKALVGYLGTIEMPKQLLPNSRLQTVCSCIKKLRQEKRGATAVLMTVLPTCLTLKNASNHILAIYPTNRIVYIGSVVDRESRYFGLVTTAVCDTRSDSLDKRFREKLWQHDENKLNNNDTSIEISNSCHVFITDPKIVDHSIHEKKAERFNIICTQDPLTGSCLEFPRSSLYIVSLVQNLYKLQDNEKANGNADPVVANSPQPSASSNSDSGIGFRDDCGNISDRILVVEFPSHNPLPYLRSAHRPSDMSLEGLDLPSNNDEPRSLELNNIRRVKSEVKTVDFKQLNNLNNVRACEPVSIKNYLDKSGVHEYLVKQNNDSKECSRLNCRALPDPSLTAPLTDNIDDQRSLVSADSASVDEIGRYEERAVDVPEEILTKKSLDFDFKSSADNISVHSSKSLEFSSLLNVFKVPFESKKAKRHVIASSCDNLDKYNENMMSYKLSPKVYGLSKPNYSCEELNTLNASGKISFGNLQDLKSWAEHGKERRMVAQSEPDVRHLGNDSCDQNGVAKCSSSEGPAAWARSFEKLLEDPLGLHTFAEFLKKEFSAENIYFWTACERFRNLPLEADRATEAQRIYHHHLSVGATEAINVDAQGRNLTERCLQDPTSTIFEQLQKQIFNLMKFDSYPRFLKSDIYKQCLAGVIEKSPLDARLALTGSIATPTKLKKSVSNAEDRRRKSLLPWHRKNRSRSKDRGDIEAVHVCKEMPFDNLERNDKNETHSSVSSLTSLDLAGTGQESTKSRLNFQENLGPNGIRPALCRVLLSNGSTTVVQIKETESIQELVTRLLDKRGLQYMSFEVFTDKHPKPMDINEPSSRLAGCEVTVEQRVVFKVDLPNRKTINIKSKYTKIIIDVLRPSLHKYQYNLDTVVVLNGGTPIDLRLPVTSIDGLRLNVQPKEDFRPAVMRTNSTNAHRLDEITNKVFEGILQEKADSTKYNPPRSDKGSVKSEDWGSEHSSTFIGKFLRRDSGINDRKKKGALTCKGIPVIEGGNSEQSQSKKPLIAKWKTGANKLNVGSNDTEDVMEDFSRCQKLVKEPAKTHETISQLLDFNKDKENHQTAQQRLSQHSESDTNTRFYIGETANHPKVGRVPIAKNLKLDLHSNYENRSVIATNKYIPTQNSQRLSPTSPVPEETSSKQSKMATVKENKPDDGWTGRNVPRPCEPPPLPPKPKIVPIKPQNWGQLNGFYKPKDLKTASGNQAMFLEQPSSSFV